MLLYTKERSRVIRSLKMSDVSDPLVNPANWSKKRAIHWQNSYFSYVFWQFSTFFIPESESLTLLFAHLLFFKERLERFAPIAIYQRATMSDLLTWLFRSQKTSDSLENSDEIIPNPAKCTQTTVQVTLVCAKVININLLNLSSYILRGRKMNHLIMWFSEL